MAINIYLRVSTQAQHFTQQMQDIRSYFDAHGLNMDSVANTVEEKESGGKSYEDRKLQQLINKCKPGDYIYAASTDRLGRNFVDMIRMMEAAKKRGIIIVACKQGLSLADDSVATRILLSVTSIIDEDERMRIKHRVKNGVNAATDDIKKHGSRMTKRGTIQTHCGNEKGTDETKRIMAVAREAAAQAAADRTIQWRESSQAVRYALRRRAEGAMAALIVNELGALYDDFALANPDAPNPYATPNGCKPQKGTVSKWLREANPLVLVG